METQENIIQTEQDEAEELAALEATFGEAEEEGAGSTSTDQEAPVEIEEDTTPQTQGTETQEPKAITLEDFQAAIEAAKQEQKTEISKLHDRVFGKIGDLQQKLDTIRGASAKTKERLAVEFPELADLLFENDIAGFHTEGTQAAPVVAPQVAVPNVQDIIRKEVEPLKLAVLHPDWEQTVATADFATWRDSVLPTDAATELSSSWDAKFIAGKLTEYKAWQAAQAAQANRKQANQERLGAAVTPQGLPRAAGSGIDTDDEEAAMLKAFSGSSR